ncbi:hypothetical protein [Isobaculum melis]|uniref:Uncharacterized protein n=1 Tax=Isobaculum melis TaxID=142588 RepID=A0A1H9U790_9LACT|nr:hypothetical protein [Isobaculum melis]SES05017.1 hypothetical protein SAMN04488559_12225 [Isobaculum melis]
MRESRVVLIVMIVLVSTLVRSSNVFAESKLFYNTIYAKKQKEVNLADSDLKVSSDDLIDEPKITEKTEQTEPVAIPSNHTLLHIYTKATVSEFQNEILKKENHAPSNLLKTSGKVTYLASMIGVILIGGTSIAYFSNRVKKEKN